ncbi:MAG: amino acid-binding protein [Gammaproteobacteria bacterium]|nr:amino acid-binding protein [Gammaproteobacteria bacterium]
MAEWSMLTLVGEDRPGIVAAVTEVLFASGCNLGETAMVRLGGNFSMMLMVSRPTDGCALDEKLSSVMERFGLQLHQSAIIGELHSHLQPNLQLVVYGADRAGIVASVTAKLAEAGFHILDLRTDVGGSSRDPIYVMEIEGYADQEAAELEQRLEPLRQQGVEWRLSTIDLMVG